MLRQIKQTVDRSFSKKLIEKNTLFISKLAYTFHGDHEHYFNNDEVRLFMKKSSRHFIDPRCKVCGMRLTHYRAGARYETMEIPAYKDGE